MTDDPRASSLQGVLVLGVDFGTVRVGLALGDGASGLVLALPVLAHPGRDEDLAARLAELAHARDATHVVLGNPLHMTGAPSAMSRRVAALRDAVARALPIPVLLRDERRSSVDAEAQLRAAGLRWWQVPKGQIDAGAAIALVRELLIELDPRLALLADGEAQAPQADEGAPPPRAGREGRRRALRKRRRRARPGEGQEDGGEGDG